MHYMQVVNRDLSVAVLKQFSKMRREEIQNGKLKIRPVKQKGPEIPGSVLDAEGTKKNPEDIRILEGLAASGLRAIRYALEVGRSPVKRLPHPHWSIFTASYLPDDSDDRIWQNCSSQKLHARLIGEESCWWDSVWLQLDGVSQIDANDIDPKSVQAIERNIAYNGTAASERVHTTQVLNVPPDSFVFKP